MKNVEIYKRVIKTAVLNTIYLDYLFGYNSGVTFDYCPHCNMLPTTKIDRQEKVNGLRTPTNVLIGFVESTKCPHCGNTLSEKIFDLKTVEKTIDEVIESIELPPLADRIVDFDDFLDLVEEVLNQVFQKLSNQEI